MQIAIGLPIGYQAGAGGAVGVFDYLVKDEFTTDRAAGAVDGTDAEPGPGVRNIDDTENKISLSSGEAVFNGGKASPSYNDPALGFVVTRNAGKLCIWKFSVATTTGQAVFGYGVEILGKPGAGQQGGAFFRNGDIRGDVAAGFFWQSVAAFSTGEHELAVVLRSAGSVLLKKVSGSWVILWIEQHETLTSGYWSATCHSLPFNLHSMTSPAERWLPSPLASDGFSAWGISDGLGHAEGVAGGLGSGGNAITWTARIGTWTASAGQAAASALSSSKATATAASGKADVIATVEVTRSAGVAGLVLRYVDADNYIYAVHNGTNAQLIKRVATVETTLINAAATYSAGAELRVICEGTKFRLYYNNAQIGSEQTIADAALQAPTAHGLYTTDTGNTFDDFTVYARGSGGEYDSVLDAI